MKKTMPLLVLLVSTALILAILVSASSPRAFGPRAALLMTVSGQEWEEGRYLPSALHYIFAVVLSASDTLQRSALTLSFYRAQRLLERDQFHAALDLCRRALAISIDQTSTRDVCDDIEAQMPEADSAK